MLDTSSIQYSNAFLSLRDRNAQKRCSSTTAGDRGHFLETKHLVFKNGGLEPGLKPKSILKILNLHENLPKDVLK